MANPESGIGQITATVHKMEKIGQVASNCIK